MNFITAWRWVAMTTMNSPGSLPDEVASHWQLLRQNANMLLHDYYLAQDLTQDTMYNALRNLDKFEYGSSLKSWLFRIQYNLFVTQYRVGKRMTTCELSDTFFDVATTANLAESNLGVEQIEMALLKLDQLHQRVFRLRLAGYRYDEIASELQMPLGSVKSTIHRARKLLIQWI